MVVIGGWGLGKLHNADNRERERQRKRMQEIVIAEPLTEKDRHRNSTEASIGPGLLIKNRLL
jgi:hypothetical protein